MNDRRWVQFSLKTFLLLVAICCAFLAGRASLARRVEEAEGEAKFYREQVKEMTATFEKVAQENREAVRRARLRMALESASQP